MREGSKDVAIKDFEMDAEKGEVTVDLTKTQIEALKATEAVDIEEVKKKSTPPPPPPPES